MLFIRSIRLDPRSSCQGVVTSVQDLNIEYRRIFVTDIRGRPKVESACDPSADTVVSVCMVLSIFHRETQTRGSPWM